MITVPQGLRDSPTFWHDAAGHEWLDRLPALVDQTCRAWELQVEGPPRHGSHALVVPVRTAHGPAALRLSVPSRRAAGELRALRFWSGTRVVGLVRATDDGAAVLLQRLDADRPLSGQPTDEVAEVLGGLVADLAAMPPPSDVASTGGEAADLVEHGQSRWEALGRPFALAALDRALELAAGLTTDDPGLAVDGDLHAGQVLPDAGGAWRVVDPLLMRGDPTYDLARAVWTTADRLPDQDAIRRFADRLMGATGLDRSRARAWLEVRTVAYWLWCLEAGLTEDPSRCARVASALAPRPA